MIAPVAVDASLTCWLACSVSAGGRAVLADFKWGCSPFDKHVAVPTSRPANAVAAKAVVLP